MTPEGNKDRLKRSFLFLVTLLWIWSLVSLYQHQGRTRRQGIAPAQVADQVGQAWQARFRRISDSDAPIFFTSISGWAALMFSGGEEKLDFPASQDVPRASILFAWWAFTGTSVIFAGCGALGRGAWTRAEPAAVRSQPWESAWGGFLSWQYSGFLVAGLAAQVGAGWTGGWRLLLQQFLAYMVGFSLAATFRARLRPRFDRTKLAWGVAGFGAATVGVSLADALVHHLLSAPPHSDNLLLTVIHSASGAQLLLWLLGIVLLGPALEEIWFRQLLLGSLEGSPGRGSRLPPLLLSSFVFAAIHVDPQAFLQLFTLGIVFGAVRLRTGSWEAAWCSHILWNLSTFILVSLA